MSHCSGWSDTNNPFLSTSNLMPHQLYLDLIRCWDKLDRWTHNTFVAAVCMSGLTKLIHVDNCCAVKRIKQTEKRNKTTVFNHVQVYRQTGQTSQWLKNRNELWDCFLLSAYSLFSYCAYANEDNGQEGGMEYREGERGKGLIVCMGIEVFEIRPRTSKSFGGGLEV